MATSGTIPAIDRHYVFGDFVSGRLWAIPLPRTGDVGMVQAKSLGRWPFLPSTFGRDGAGNLYVAGFGKGTLYKLTPATTAG